MSVFSIHSEFVSDPRQICLFGSISGKEYDFTYTVYSHNIVTSSANTWHNSNLMYDHRGGHASFSICFSDCDDPADIVMFPLELEPIYVQHRPIDLDDEANPTKISFDRPVRKLELD